MPPQGHGEVPADAATEGLLGPWSSVNAHYSYYPRDHGKAPVWAAASLGARGCPRACAELFSAFTGSGELRPLLPHEQQRLEETLRVGPAF